MPPRWAQQDAGCTIRTVMGSNTSILPFRDASCSPQAMLKDRDASVKALLKAEEKMHADREKGKENPSPALQQAELTELRQQLKNTEKSVDNNMELFEHCRVEGVREMLDEYIRCELYYHCRALELMAPALTYLKGIDGETASEQVREDITTLNRKLKYI